MFRLAWRNAWRSTRRTAIVVIAVAVGIAGCLFSMAINFGMVAQMVETAIATDLGHVQIHAAGFDDHPELEVRLLDGGAAAQQALESRPAVRAFARRVRGEGLLNSPRSSAGVSVLAIDPAREAGVSLLADSLVAGEWLDDGPRVLIGDILARRLQVEVGDKVVLSVQELDGDLGGRAFRIAGTFRTPSRDLDQGVVVMPISRAQELFGLGEAVSEVVVIARTRSEIPMLREQLRDSLGAEVEVRTWEELRPLLVYMVQTFDTSAWYLYVAVFIAMAFGIANVLLMAVYERAREIGMLMAVGMRRRRVIAMIVTESLLVTGMGLLAGVALAVGGVWALRDGIDLSAFSEGLTAYGIGTRIIPILRVSDLAVPVAVATVAALLASAWPAARAASSRPAEALRRV